MSDNRQVAEVLRKGLDLLGPNGEEWARDPDLKHHCCVTAIHAGSYANRAIVPAKELFRTVIGRASIIDWNDAPERTWPEIKAAFEKAIAKAEATNEPA